MKILITGASGFVGKYCFTLLRDAGYDVLGICNSVTNDFYSIDLLHLPYNNFMKDFILANKFDYMIHLAWDVKDGYIESSNNLEWTIASLRLFKDFYENGGKRAVSIGTCFEYDPDSFLRKEVTTPLSPDTLYGECKKSFYEIMMSYSYYHNLSYSHARLFYLFGPGEYSNRLVPSVINALNANERAKCSHGEQIRDFLYVEDAATAILAVLFSDYTGPINIGSGSGILVKDLVNQIAKQMNKEHLVDFGSLPSEDEPPAIVAETGIINSWIGWQPKYTLNQGISKTIESLSIKL